MNRPAFQRCSRREIPSAAEGGGFEPPVREPVRQFSKLLVSATHPSFQKDPGVRNLGVISSIAGAKVRRIFEPCKFFRYFFQLSFIFLLFPPGKGRFAMFSRSRSSAEHPLVFTFWSGIRDSNPRPSAWEANALPTELIPQREEKRVRLF